jgi:hypothetical protein
LPPILYIYDPFQNTLVPSTSSSSNCFIQISPPTPCTYISSPSYVMHDSSIACSLVWWSKYYLVMITHRYCEAPHYSINSSLLFSPSILRTSLITLFSNTASRCPSLNVRDLNCLNKSVQLDCQHIFTFNVCGK